MHECERCGVSDPLTCTMCASADKWTRSHNAVCSVLVQEAAADGHVELQEPELPEEGAPGDDDDEMEGEEGD